MQQRQFLRMMATFLDVSEQISHTTPNQFEMILQSTVMDPMLKSMFELEEEIRIVRVSYEEQKKCNKKIKKEVEKEQKEEKELKDQKKEVKEKEEKEQKDQKKEVKEKGKEKEKKLKDSKKQEEIPEVVIQEEEIPPGEDDGKLPIHLRRKTIPKYIKSLVWNQYIGVDNTTGKCVCCLNHTIDCRSFHCGHVIAEAKGGDLSITNLRPICASCNLAMSTKSMNEFCLEFFKREIPK